MPEENTFDRISRLLATPMPRRQAMKLIAGITLGALSSSPLLAQKPSKSPKHVSGDKMPIHNIVMHGVAMNEVFTKLRQDYAVPISYVVSESTLVFDITVHEGTVRDVLNQMTIQDKSYTWKLFGDKIIFFPKLAKYELPIKGISVVGVPRDEALTSFVTYLREHVSGFEDYGTLLVGFIPPEYKTPITLPKDGTVIDFLQQLVSGDYSVFLSVTTPSFSGMSYFFLGTVVDKPKTGGSRNNELVPTVFGLTSTTPNGSRSISSNSSQAVCRALSVNYDAPNGVGCPTGQCGVMSTANISGVTACPGDDCSGLPERESVTLDFTNPNGLPVCAPTGTSKSTDCGNIGSNNTLSCEDQYNFCMSPFPTATCSQTFSQEYIVNNRVVATTTLTYTLTVPAPGQCQASFVRGDPTNNHTADQCCGTNPSSSGPDPMTLCSSSQTCASDNGTANAICCPSGDTVACNHVCCTPGQGCVTDKVTGNMICCPAGTGIGCNGTCCSPNYLCISGSCCAPGQITSDSKTCCPAGQTPYGTICCPTGQNNCGNICCANTCCNGKCCDPGCTCVGGGCCGQPAPHLRMSTEAVLRGSYATDNLATCCAPGYPPCGNVCCASGSVCCGGSCCAGTCDSTGACIPPPNENP